MKIELEERNSGEAQHTNDQILPGSKHDYVVLRISHSAEGYLPSFDVLEITEAGQFNAVASTDQNDGPVLEVKELDSSFDGDRYLLRITYLSLPGHLIRVRRGNESAEVMVWFLDGFKIIRNESGGESWFVVDCGQATTPVVERSDSYALNYQRTIGPYPSRTEAQKHLLLFAVDGLCEAVLNDSGVERWLLRARDAAAAVRLSTSMDIHEQE